MKVFRAEDKLSANCPGLSQKSLWVWYPQCSWSRASCLSRLGRRHAGGRGRRRGSLSPEELWEGATLLPNRPPICAYLPPGETPKIPEEAGGAGRLHLQTASLVDPRTPEPLLWLPAPPCPAGLPSACPFSVLRQHPIPRRPQTAAVLCRVMHGARR